MNASSEITLSELSPNDYRDVMDYAQDIFLAADQSSSWKSMDRKAKEDFAIKVANLDPSEQARLMEISLLGRGGNPGYQRGLTRNVTPKVEWLQDFVNAPPEERPKVFSKIAMEAAEVAKDRVVDIKTGVSALSIGFSACYFPGAVLIGTMMGPVAGTALVTHALNSGIAHFVAPKVLEYVADKAFEKIADKVDDSRIPEGAKSAVQFGMVLFKLAATEYGTGGLDKLLDMADGKPRPELVEQLNLMLAEHGLNKAGRAIESSAAALRHFKKDTLEKLSHGVELSEKEIEQLIEASKHVKDAMKDEGDNLVKSMASKSRRMSLRQQDSALVHHAQNPLGSSMALEAVKIYARSDLDDAETQAKANRLSSRMKYASNPHAESSASGADKLLSRAEVYLTLGMDDPTFEKYRNAGWMAKSAMLFSHVPTPGESRAASMAAAMEKLGSSAALRTKLSLVVQTAQTVNTVKTLTVLAAKPVVNVADTGIKTVLGGTDAALDSVGLHSDLRAGYEMGIGKIKTWLASRRDTVQATPIESEVRRPTPH